MDEVIDLIGAGIHGRASVPPVFNKNDNGKSDPTPLKRIGVQKQFRGGIHSLQDEITKNSKQGEEE